MQTPLVNQEKVKKMAKVTTLQVVKKQRQTSELESILNMATMKVTCTGPRLTAFVKSCVQERCACWMLTLRQDQNNEAFFRMFGNIFLETFTLVEFVMHGSDNFVFIIMMYRYT